jgi:uncharacterized iron-regulated protein
MHKEIDVRGRSGDARGTMRARIRAILIVVVTSCVGSAASSLAGCKGHAPLVRPALRPTPPAAAAEVNAIDASTIAGRDPRHLPMFDGRSGERLTWNDLMGRILASDVIILGEEHDDALGHAVQLAVVQNAAERWPREGALSMEMLERDEQVVVDDFLEGLIDVDTFARLTESVDWAGAGTWAKWYQPIIDAAAAGGWSVTAANAPRRYVRIARTEGYDRLKKLPPQREALIALPRTWPMDYRQRFINVMNEAGDDDDEDEDEDAVMVAATQVDVDAKAQATTAPSATTATAPSTAPATRPNPHGPMKPEDIDPGFRSQLLWDATMADSIVRTLRTGGTKKVIHLVGQFHSDFAGGTVKEIRARAPITRVLTVSMQRTDSGSLRERDRDRADVIIYTGQRDAK